jgi:hypothetical protein
MITCLKPFNLLTKYSGNCAVGPTEASQRLEDLLEGWCVVHLGVCRWRRVVVIRCAVMEAAKDMPYGSRYGLLLSTPAAGILAYPSSSNPVLGGRRSYDCYQWREF